VVWGGATFDVIRRINQMQRQSRRFARVRLRPKDLQGLSNDPSRPEREDFACFFMCGGCGFLHDPRPGNEGFDCEACGAKGGVDLSHIDAAQELRNLDELSRMQPSSRERARAQGFAVALGLGVGMLIWAANPGMFEDDAGFYWAPFVLFMGLLTWMVGRGVYVLFQIELYELFHVRRGTRPARWRLPLPLVDERSPPSRKVSGTVEAREDLLRAPVSGRECLAYEVAVLFDVKGDAKKPMWVLEEEANAAFELGGQGFERGGATISLPLEAVPVQGEDGDAMTERLSMFLRQRGLYATDGHFAFYEALVLPGKSYEASLHEGRAGRGWVVSQGEPGTRVGPETTAKTTARLG
jgi:hypothetical protein